MQNLGTASKFTKLYFFTFHVRWSVFIFYSHELSLEILSNKQSENPRVSNFPPLKILEIYLTQLLKVKGDIYIYKNLNIGSQNVMFERKLPLIRTLQLGLCCA